MPRKKQKQTWTSIVVPESFLFRLKSLQGKSAEAYWKFLSRVLDDYQTLYRQNVQLNARFYGEPPIEQVMRTSVPALQEVQT